MFVLYSLKKETRLRVHTFLLWIFSQHSSFIETLENSLSKFSTISFDLGNSSISLVQHSTVSDFKKALTDFYYAAKCRCAAVIWISIFVPIDVIFFSSHIKMYLLSNARHCSYKILRRRSGLALQFLMKFNKRKARSSAGSIFYVAWVSSVL